MHVYTQDSLFYKELNKRLRLWERENLKPFFPYLKQFLTSLHGGEEKSGGHVL